jgi:hypothetical protein
MKRTELKRTTGLKPGGPLKAGEPLKRTGKLAAESPKAKATRLAVSKACPLAAHCAACGTNRQLTRSHILTQKMHPHQAANPLNVITLCWEHHCVWENQKPAFRALFPAVWNTKLAAMRKLNRSYYALFCQKHGGPTPYTN